MRRGEGRSELYAWVLPREADRAAQASDPSPDSRLTKREPEVLEAMAQGATNPEIADRLGIALSTVKSHVSNILRKLGATNRTQAVAPYLRSRRQEPDLRH